MFYFDINTFWRIWGREDINVSPSTPFPSRPHRWWYHPNKSLIEIVVTFFLKYLLPFNKMCSCPAIMSDSSDSEAHKGLHDCRRWMNSLALKGYEQKLDELKRKYQWEVMPCHNTIPCRKNILIEWGIIDSDNSMLVQEQDSRPEKLSSFVSVYVHGPSYLLTTTTTTATTLSECHDLVTSPSQPSCLSKLIKLQNRPSVPIILWIHGGGMVCGSPEDLNGLVHVGDLLNLQEKILQERVMLLEEWNKNRSEEGTNDIIFITVKYSLAPEHPFPSAIIDCLSVVEHLIKRFPTHPIHLAGISAGANITSVLTFECARRYPGRISSSCILQPMLVPTADTISYHMNSESSFMSGDWLRWCWRAYLSLNDSTTQSYSLSNSRESHKDAYSASKWISSSDVNIRNMQRLFSPHVSLPTKEALSPLVIVASRGDLLFDDGRHLAIELKRICGNETEDSEQIVTYIETNGDHVTGLSFDKEKQCETLKAVHRLVFGNESY